MRNSLILGCIFALIFHTDSALPQSIDKAVAKIQKLESIESPPQKSANRMNRQLKTLTKQIFACKPDAMEALLNFQASLETHALSSYSVETIRPKRPPGRPAQEKVKVDIEGYQLKAELVRKETTTEEFQQKRSRFILATNQLDELEWPAQKLLEEYKNQ